MARPRSVSPALVICLLAACRGSACGARGSGAPDASRSSEPTTPRAPERGSAPALPPTFTLTRHPLPEGRFTQVTIDGSSLCAIAEGTGEITCTNLGDRPDEGTEKPPAGPFVSVAGRASSGCATRADRSIVCWGESRALGDRVKGAPVQHVVVSDEDGCAALVSGDLVCSGTLAKDAPSRARDVDVSQGNGACAVNEDGLRCWYYRDDTAEGDFTRVAASAHTQCALDARGGRCWDRFSETPDLEGFTSLAAGRGHFCGQLRGELRCFGRDDHGEMYPPPIAVRSFDAEESLTCWADEEGKLGCVGQGFLGGLPRDDVAAITVVESGGCALLRSGEILCFGARSGFPGGSPAIRARPDTRAWTGPFVGVSADKRSGCALREGGEAQCWGDDLPRRPPGAWKSLDVGLAFACGLRLDGEAECFSNSNLHVHDQDKARRLLTPPEGTFTSVEAGVTWACGLRPSGEAACWGYKDYSDYEYEWAPPPADARFTRLSVGYNHVCAITQARDALCWGRDRFGETTPQKGPLLDIDAGEVKTCAVQESGELTCWGRADAQDQLPKGPFTRVAVEKYNDEATAAVVCGVRASGALACGWF